VVPCAACGARNRVPILRLGDGPLCSDCRARLLPENPLELGDNTFGRFVAGSSLPVLVDLWAPWCGPCRTMAPEFAAAAVALRGRALLAKLDTEANPRTAARLQVQAIPTMALFVGGREIARTSGAQRAAEIVRWFDQRVTGR